MATDTNSPDQSSQTPEGLIPLDEYRRAAEHERIRAEITLKNAMLNLEKARGIDEEFLVDEHGRFYTTDLSRAQTVGRERVPVISYGPSDLLSEDILERCPLVGMAFGSGRGRLESIAFEEERLVLGNPIIDHDAFIDARCYLDHHSVILTIKREAYLLRNGERHAVTSVRHGLPLEAISDYLIAQGTPNHLIDEALTLIERRRSALPE